jgi:hypothetical protein
MAKNDILGASLWDAYSNKVTTLMNNPQHQGEITEEEAAEHGNKLIVADFGAESCVMRSASTGKSTLKQIRSSTQSSKVSVAVRRSPLRML